MPPEIVQRVIPTPPPLSIQERMIRINKVVDLEAEIQRLEGEIAVAAGASLQNLQTLLEEVFKNYQLALAEERMIRIKNVAELEETIQRREREIAMATGASRQNLQTLLEEVYQNYQLALAERAAFERATEEQAMLASIKEFAGPNMAVVSLLQKGPDWEGWDDRVYAFRHGSSIAAHDAKFWKALRLALVNFHALFAFAGNHLVDHERTVWIDQVIIWFAALRITVPIQWRWCETKYRARDDEEGTQLAEAHSEGDTYKLIENSVYALREIFAAHKDVSWERMKNMQVPSCK
ncbi:hypothetical protein HDU88_002436 [Geranomyces variabilis]|nr:hypothetical protein HDU88_002436 [Geranomyces variabilis]